MEPKNAVKLDNNKSIPVTTRLMEKLVVRDPMGADAEKTVNVVREPPDCAVGNPAIAAITPVVACLAIRMAVAQDPRISIKNFLCTFFETFTFENQ